ncbi:hypothetical protein [Bordetella tumulicola]|uniref:hypothetical protein n=1 Tax=Bordetella tumulicola TaxID=1649133 RepID=UPI0039F05CFC
MIYRWMIAALCGVMLAGCGKEEPQPPAAAPAADDATVTQDAQKRRQRFQGDGKAQYTPYEAPRAQP